jgi:hypothetical protein
VRITVVTGTRDATPTQLARLVRDLEESRPELVVVGDCPDGFHKLERRPMKSIDAAAETWCDAHGIETIRGIARWRKRGKAAGPRRNQAMAVVAGALRRDRHVVTLLAYPGSGTGTQDAMARFAKEGLE